METTGYSAVKLVLFAGKSPPKVKMRKKHILLINPKWFESEFKYFPIGLGLIASILCEGGFFVEVLDLSGMDAPNNSITNFIKEKRKPDAIGISGKVTHFHAIRELITGIRKTWKTVPVVLGGSINSFVPDELLLETGADVFVFGEAEDKILQLMQYIDGDLTKVNGIKFRNNTEIVKTVSTETPPNISQSPICAYHLFPMEKYLHYYKKTNRCFDLYSSKGCPINCPFCFRISGDKVRHRNVESVVAEILHLKSKYTIDSFNFVDDSFALNRKWVVEFCKKVTPLKIKWRFQAHVMNIQDRELLSLMVDSGLIGISLGLESGSSKVQKKIGKNINLEKAENIILYLLPKGIKVYSGFIIGFPNDSWETIEETKEFMVRTKFNKNFNLSFLSLYPGTYYYRDAFKNGIIKNELEYLKNLKLQDELYVNITKYPNDVLKSWKEYILREIAEANHRSMDEYEGYNFKKKEYIVA